MKQIGIIIGSTREVRKALIIGEYIQKESISDNNEYIIVDLKDYHLPHYNEPGSPRTSKEYKFDTTKKWSETIRSLDGFIFVTPEYNGFFTGAVKDAVDYLHNEWYQKPFSVVSYGGGGGKSAALHLTTLLQRFEMETMGSIYIYKPWEAIKSNGTINTELIEGSLSDVFDRFNSKVIS